MVAVKVLTRVHQHVLSGFVLVLVVLSDVTVGDRIPSYQHQVLLPPFFFSGLFSLPFTILSPLCPSSSAPPSPLLSPASPPLSSSSHKSHAYQMTHMTFIT